MFTKHISDRPVGYQFEREGDISVAICAFVAATDVYAKISLANNMLNPSVATYASREVGMMALLETACIHTRPGTTEQKRTFGLARNAADREVNIATENNRVTRSSLMARQILLDIPLLKPIYAHNVMPEFEIIEKHFSDTVLNADIGLSYLSQRNTSTEDKNRTFVAGYISELAVRLLLQRYAILNIGDNSWLPLSAQLTEDCTPNNEDGTKPEKWDVSVLTKLEPKSSIKKPYKIQVKSNDRPIPACEEVINISPEDIRLNRERNGSFLRVLDELVDEYYSPSRHLASNLDMRTEKLIDKLG